MASKLPDTDTIVVLALTGMFAVVVLGIVAIEIIKALR